MPDMLKVVKGNVEYRIPSHKKKEYLDQGYSVLDENGKVLVEGHPVTLKDYQQRIAELENENIEAGNAYCKLYEEHEKLIVEYTGCGRKRNLVLVEMEYSGDEEVKRLSVCGSIMNAAGTDSIHGGQCLDVIAEYVYTPLFKEIYRLWKLYHLNDMHAECEHQAELGWREIAKKEVVLYHFQMNREASKRRAEIKDNVIAAAAAGESILLTPNERNLLNNKFFINAFSEELPKTIAPLYELKNTERKMLGWLYEKDHPEGILCKPCPVCGYEYGSSWKYFPIPEEDEKIILHLLKTGEVPA